jgi:hypothetical protein
MQISVSYGRMRKQGTGEVSKRPYAHTTPGRCVAVQGLVLYVSATRGAAAKVKSLLLGFYKVARTHSLSFAARR